MTTKAFLDFLCGVILFIIALPVMICAGIAVKLDSKGPVFYLARRMGQFGKPFYLYKFRTMINNAAQIGPGITTVGDPRITRVGRFLRMTKIDELPQVLNVLKGELAIVGPRPEDPQYTARYTASQKEILSIKPGITSPASLKYCHEEEMVQRDKLEEVYFKKILPDKIKIDTQYEQHRNLRSDLKIIFLTFISMFIRR